MIRLGNKIIAIDHFPDGALKIDVGINKINAGSNFKITWKFENNEELIALIYIVNHLRRINKFTTFMLEMDYIPNARMDRVKSNNDVFTLKYFADIINSLNFVRVFVLDPHSSVSEALINNIHVKDLTPYRDEVLKEIGDDIVVYFPDASAKKKYEDLFKGFKMIYGVKHRNWVTGKIERLEVVTEDLDLNNQTVLMWDDLISYGGSMYYGAMELKELGVGNIYAYASHTEDSILDKEKGTLIKLLENDIVKRLFTTNSLITKEHEKITILD